MKEPLDPDERILEDLDESKEEAPELSTDGRPTNLYLRRRLSILFD